MSYVYLNHLTIETTSPLAIGTGEREIGFDNQLIRDVNKLPYIPSTSIAGVWRSLANLRLGNDITDKWFGHLETKSKLTISQGYLLDTHQNVVKGLLSKERIQADPLLSYLQQSNPMHRERVRLNDRGVATEKGKFDQILLPSGLRFNVTLQWQGESESELNQFKELLALWQDNQLAFGSNTTNGLGQTKLISQSASLISLCDDPSAGKALRTARTNYANRNEIIATPEQPFATLALKGTGTWRSGQGNQHLSKQGLEADADVITYSEAKVEWLNNKATLSVHAPLITGSTVKGIIAHRFSYHLRRLNKQWAETQYSSGKDEWVLRPAEADDLFGYANEKSGEGKSGRLIFHDAHITNFVPVVRYHNAIDRFTGGVIQGALYSEELLEHPEFTIQISAKSGTTITPIQHHALLATFEDIEMGLLPIGGGSGRGHSLTEKHGVWEINWDLITISEAQEEVVGANE